MAGLASLATGYRVNLDQRQSETFCHYYDLLCDWNQRVRLVGNTDADEILYKFFLDSLVLGRAVRLNEAGAGRRLADVGSGAGFPGVPIAIAWPDVSVTLIESVSKKAAFLQMLATELGLANVTVICERAEVLGRTEQHREQYDVVLVRAVGDLALTAELCLPLVKVGGLMATTKRADEQVEVEEAAPAVRLLGGELPEPVEFDLPGFEGRRRYLIVEKRQPTPAKFPRKTAQLKKHQEIH